MGRRRSHRHISVMLFGVLCALALFFQNCSNAVYMTPSLSSLSASGGGNGDGYAGIGDPTGKVFATNDLCTDGTPAGKIVLQTLTQATLVKLNCQIQQPPLILNSPEFSIQTLNGRNLITYNQQSFWGTPAASFVQQFERTVTVGVASLSTASVNLTANSLLVCAFISSGPQLVSMSDTLGNTYSRISGPLTTNIGTWTSEVWYAQNVLGGPTVLTASFSSANNDKSLQCLEYQGIASNALDTFATASAPGGTTATIDPITATSNLSLVFNFVQVGGPAAVGDSTYQLRSSSGGNVAQDRPLSQSGSTSPITITNTGGGYQSHLIVFRSK